MTWRIAWRAALAACLLASSPVQASDVEALPAYAPEARVDGVIRIWGHGSYGAHTDFVEGLTRAWQDGFKAHHPGIVFENRLHGTASAIGALYTGQGDLAFMGREIWPPEIAAFEEVRGYAPTGVDVLTGSFDVRNKGYAIVVFVHKDNPVESLTLAQLDAAFGIERRRGHAPVHTWGDLGLTGEWATRPVNLHGLAIARGFADFFEDAVFDGGHLWQPSMREYADDPGSRGGASDGGQKLLDALALDRDGLGWSGLLYGHPDVKPIAVAVDAHTSAVMPTRDSVADHRYPLRRVITMFLDRAPGQPVEPRVAEFLRYILSREGQQLVVDEGKGYLPVPVDVVRRGREQLR
ncbi:PstS family phosphate ABC transporter substrate-binding protein [Dokdonella sp. MW10]|uniref:PstS family phosphate ABC transporter substrate-binding protein n=1 Tax=Dokdonella sp. MW10 TaxID=2992926 RepID=UPI003F7FD90B